MLVLSRKKGEEIVIGGNISMTIVDIRGDKVRVGIEAPLRNPRPSAGGQRRDRSGGSPAGRALRSVRPAARPAYTGDNFSKG